MDEFTVEWRGPYTFDEIIDYEGYDKEELYAIAWTPPKRVHRTKYVGMAYFQFIGQRLKQPHDADELLYIKHGVSSIRYFVGKILKRKGYITNKRVRDVEAAIIFHHSLNEDDTLMLEANIQSTEGYNGDPLEIYHIGDVPPGIVDSRIIYDDDEYYSAEI